MQIRRGFQALDPSIVDTSQQVSETKITSSIVMISCIVYFIISFLNLRNE
jgi:hypothetical protein